MRGDGTKDRQEIGAMQKNHWMPAACTGSSTHLFKISKDSRWERDIETRNEVVFCLEIFFICLFGLHLRTNWVAKRGDVTVVWTVVQTQIRHKTGWHVAQ